MQEKLVKVENLNVYYKQGKNSFHAVKDVNFGIEAGEILSLIGESGSGKTSIAKAIMSQIEFNAKKIKVDNVSIPSSPDLKTKEFRKKSAYLLQMIFQSPSSSLNPYKRVWKVIAEGMLNAKYDNNTKKSIIDLIKEKYEKKLYEFNKVLKSPIINKKIKEYNQLIKDIKDNNKDILSIDKSKRKLLHYFELVEFDQFYNDLLSEQKNKIDEKRNVMLYKGKYSLLNLKRFYKSMYRSKEESYNLQKIVSSETKNKRNETKLINLKKIQSFFKFNSKLDDKLSLDYQLKEINDSYKKAKAKIIETKKEAKLNFIKEKKEINKLYNKHLNEYATKRKKIINQIISSKILTKNKKIWKEKISKRNNLYKKIRTLIKDLDNLFILESREKKMHVKYFKERNSIFKEMNQEIKNKIKPHGSKKNIKEKVLKLLNDVGLPSSIAYSYPSQLSGGQQQRIAIARAFSMNPKFIIADEPISSLDVSLQGSIINIIRKLAYENKTSILFISHDLEMTRRISNRVMVMNKGRIVESGKTNMIFQNPIHPYTKMLISSSKTVDEALVGKKAFIYTEKDNYKSQDKRIYHLIKDDHMVFANSKELRVWGGG